MGTPWAVPRIYSNTSTQVGLRLGLESKSYGFRGREGGRGLGLGG